MKLSFRHTLTLLVGIVSLSYGASRAEAQTPGTLDSTFGSGGKVTTSFGGVYAAANAVAVQLDGKLVVVGETRSTADASSGDFAVARYNTDGALDGTFGSSGLVITDFAGGEDRANAVAIQPDGKIVVAGSASVGGFALARYLPNGQLDATFGTGGKAVSTVGTSVFGNLDGGCTGDSLASAYSVALQPDGRIVVGGTAFSGWWLLFEGAIARYNANGTLDASLNGSQGSCPGTGVRLEAPSGFEMSEGGPAKAALMSDGRILLGGSTQDGDELLWRFMSNGQPDATFASGGALMFETGLQYNSLADVAIQSDGRAIALGTIVTYAPCTNFSVNAVGLARFNLDGSSDGTFGYQGKTLVYMPAVWDCSTSLIADLNVTDLALDTSERPVVVGQLGAGAAGDFLVSRVSDAGSVEPGFGGGSGYASTDFFGLDDQANGVALQADGSIVAVGYASASANQTLFALARYVGGNGVAPVITTQPQSQTVAPSQPFSVTVAATGTAPLTYQWYVGASGDTTHPGSNLGQLFT